MYQLNVINEQTAKSEEEINTPSYLGPSSIKSKNTRTIKSAELNFMDTLFVDGKVIFKCEPKNPEDTPRRNLKCIDLCFNSTTLQEEIYSPALGKIVFDFLSPSLFYRFLEKHIMRIFTSLFEKMWFEFKSRTSSKLDFNVKTLKKYVQIPFKMSEQLFENSFDSDHLNNLEFIELSIKIQKEKFENESLASRIE